MSEENKQIIKLNANVIAPQEAAKNIENANFFEVPFDSYPELKPGLTKDVDSIEKVPAQMEDGTREFASQSNQHAALTSNDLNKLNFIEKRIKYYGERIFDIPETNRENIELYNKKMDEGLTDEEQEFLEDTDVALQEMNGRTYGVDNEGEQFFVETLGAVGDIVRSYTENKALIGGSILTGGALGGAVSLGVPIPGARIVGVGSGLTTGLVTGMTLAGFTDGFKMMKGSVYKELSNSVDDQGQPLEIDETTKTTTSYAVGILGGIASSLSGLVLAKGNPFLKRFISPKIAAQTITKNPALLAKLNILGHMAKSSLAEGGEEGLQEFMQIVGVNFAKMDETEGSFLNALNISINEESLKRVGKATALGISAGSLISGVTSVPAFKGLKERHAKAQEKVKVREAILSKQNKVLEIAGAINSSEIKELSPGELKSFKEKLYSTVVGEEAWFTLKDLQEFADTDEKKDLVRKTVDPTGELNKMAKELNTPIMLQESEILDVATEFPEFTDYMRLEPLGETPVQIRTQAQVHVEKLGQAQTKREEIFSSLGLEDDLSPEQITELDTILNPPEEVEAAITTETEFLDNIEFEPIEGIISKEEVEVLNTKELDARIEIARISKEETDKRFQTIEDRIVRDVEAKDFRATTESLETELTIVDRFKDTKNTSEAALAVTSGHKRKGFSPMAIDPASLQEDLKVIYLESPRLKSRKVFVNGGIHINDAAALSGVDNGFELLKVLDETPSRAELKKGRDQRKFRLRNRIRETITPARLKARDDAFTTITKNRLKQMKHLVSKEWPTIKRGLIKIGGRLPTVEGLNRKAKRVVQKTTLKDLKPKRYEFGEKSSRKKATQHWLKTEFEQTYKELESAALNNELRKESIIAKEKVVSAEKFWKKVNTPGVQQTLKDSGMLKAMREYTDVFKMTRLNTGQTELKSFNNFLQTQVEEGNYTPVVPDRLSDTTQSAREMTVEQYLTISEMGQYIVHQARTKNKLSKISQDRDELITAEKIAEEIDENAKKHINYDKKKVVFNADRDLKPVEVWTRKLKTFMSSTSSIKTITTELDEWKVNSGFFYETIARPIKDAYTLKRKEMTDIEAHDKKIIEQYGLKKFQKMWNEPVDVPEFSNIATLGDGEGRIRKIDLLTLMAYMGDPDGRKSIPNYVNRNNEPLSIDTVKLVLERELSEADAALVQSLMVDRFNRFKDRSFDLHKRTAGVEPTMVEGVPILHKGKQLPGGYYPLRYKMLPDEVKAEQFLEKIKNKFNNFTGVEEDHFFARLANAEQTDQGRLKERTGSKRPLDLNFDNMFEFTEAAVHDLHFREVGMDSLKILKNPINVENMKSIVGPEKFTVLLNSIKNVVSKTSETESTIFANEYGAVNKVISSIHSLHAIKAIGFNLSSALIQVDSLKNLTLRLGPKSSLYLMKAAKKITDNPVMFEEYSKLAEEINPDIKFEKDNIDTAVVKESYDFIPNTLHFFDKYNSKVVNTISNIKDLQTKMIDSSFYFVRQGDKINKIIATMAVSEQFLNGDIEGLPLSKLEKMSDSEKATKMRGVVQQALDLSLTASSTADKTPLENNKVAKMLLRYWTDRRSGLNSSISQIQKTKANIKRGEYSQAALNLGTLSLAAGISAAWMTAVRDGAEKTIKKLKVKDEEAAAELAQDFLWHFITAPVSQLAETIPVIDNVTYAADLKLRSDYRSVSVPFFGVMSEASMGLIVLKDTLAAARKGRMPKLSDVQQKVILTNMGYLLGGAPTNSMYKLGEFLQGREVKKTGRYLKQNVEELNREINLFINAFKDDPKAEKFIEDLKVHQLEVLPPLDIDTTHVVPEDTKENIKLISSEGKWNAYDNETGEAGIYQFTEERWIEISDSAPALGLTENGRVSKSTKQQEKAMDWSIESNTRDLIAFDVPVNLETLYGAHKFGLENYVEIHSANGNKKLTSLLGEQIKNDPIFKNFETVNSVKSFVSKQTRKAKEIDNN